MRMPVLNCNRCGKEDTMMMDAPRLDDKRVYCIECYAHLFPPGWTDEYQPITEPERPKAWRWVQQEDAHGCGIACLAMVTGKFYGEVKREFAPFEKGLTWWETDSYLVDHGYAVARKFKHAAHRKESREWPPEPFGDVHICQVFTPAGGHFVVVLRDGTVLDPATSVQLHVSAYTVEDMAAVVKV